MRLFHLCWLCLLWLNMDESLQQSAITCTAPVIENGRVPGSKSVYDEHEMLRFACNPLYKRTVDRPSICTKIGIRGEWVPTPACESMVCRLAQMTPAGTMYEPASRNVFLPGEILTVRCGDRYYISDLRGTSAQVRCTGDGQWTVRPICEEVVCSQQHRQQHVLLWRSWRQTKLSETVPYMCVPGYKKATETGQATCTRDGWIPNPLCEEITCKRVDIENAVIVGNKQQYKYNERARYRCKEGYRGYPTRTCGEHGWIGRSQCTAVPGNCRPPPEVENAVVESSRQEEYLPGSKVTYRCRENYTMEGGNTLQCKNGKWEKNFTCTRSCEAPPSLEDGDVRYTIKSQYSHNETVEYQCQAYYSMEGEPFRTCISGEWTGHMRCLKPCIADENQFRQHNVTLKSRDKRYFKHDEMMEFRCARGRPAGAVAMHQRCSSGVFHLPTCQ